MLTVPVAARRAGKTPETIRRWIRVGRLAARRIGTQYVIEEADLDAALGDEELPVPEACARMPDGRKLPNVVRAVRLSRVGH